MQISWKALSLKINFYLSSQKVIYIFKSDPSAILFGTFHNWARILKFRIELSYKNLRMEIYFLIILDTNSKVELKSVEDISAKFLLGRKFMN